MLEILYIDRDYVAVNKPAGLMVHRARGAPQETEFALQMVRDMLGARVYPVHRLDKPTSGVLVFGRHAEAASMLAEAFSHHRVSKRYLAVVRGHADTEGVIDNPLVKYKEGKIRSGVSQSALTRYIRLGAIELPYPVGPYKTARYSLLLITPETGRFHQIRRHLQHISHPAIGDRAHGDSAHNRFFAEAFDCSRLLLTAAQIVFIHPYTNEKINISAPLDAAFSRVIQSFAWDLVLPRQIIDYSGPCCLSSHV
ncbi:MAG: pseudouridylate synthase [Desulfobacteraceae bacterium]|nr:pseudouridylate synthase [Desulfobacteraceae bacterium]